MILDRSGLLQIDIGDLKDHSHRRWVGRLSQPDLHHYDGEDGAVD